MRDRISTAIRRKTFWQKELLRSGQPAEERYDPGKKPLVGDSGEQVRQQERMGKMDKNKTIEKLNECLRHEWTGVAQYAQAGFVVAGLWREVYSEMFFDNAKESFGHAKQVGEKIVALGGLPTVERNAVQQTSDLVELLNYALEFESKAVKLYNEALLLAAGDRALEVFIENILEEEQDGVDELTRILRDPKAIAASTGAAKVG